MELVKKIIRWLLGTVLLVIGLMGTFDHLSNGYDQESVGILLYGDIFRNLHNSIMLSYMGIVIRVLHIVIGVLLFTKKYWFVGLLIHLPIAFNIFCIHVFHDLPFAHAFFFSMGMFVSLTTFFLVFLEKDRLKPLLILN
ncbi:MAG: hypothetical protein ACFB2Y_19820 [Fulvivirga sp.]